MYQEHKNVVNMLVEGGTTLRAALVIVGLSQENRRVYMKQRERVRSAKRNKVQATIAPWRCPGCGHRIKHTTCLACKLEERLI